MKKDRIAIIGTVGLPAKYGGFETLADQLVSNLANKYDFTVYCSGKKYPKAERIHEYKGAELKYIPLNANGIQSIIYDAWSILDAMKKNDVLLILGVAGAWILPFVKLFTRKKIIISIDGIEWKREKWSMLAKFYLWWAEKLAVKYSHIDISDNESIQDYTAQRYESLSRVIEYGADHTMKILPTIEDFKKYPFLNKDYAVKVCRIEPENNIHLVLDAFNRQQTIPLVIVGNWNNSAYGRNLKEKYKESEMITMLDPIYVQHEIDMLRSNAKLYIHGHSAGGTNPSLVEAMYLNLPVFSFDVSYNRTTTEGKALYFSTTEELLKLLINVSDYQLFEMAFQMKAIALRRYVWSKIALKYDLLICEALNPDRKKSVMPRWKKLKPDVLKELNVMHLQNGLLFYE